MFNVPEKEIEALLEKTKQAAKSPSRIIEILEKAKKRALITKEAPSEYIQGLNQEELATLLNLDSSDKELMQLLFETALLIKQSIYGNRMVIFAPLYLSNHCQGSCLYCGFREENTQMDRKILTNQELIEEVETLQQQGHKRLLLLTGDHPAYSFDDFIKAIDTVSSIKTKPFGEIRRINVEIPSLTIPQFKKLKATDKIGTYALFQETYHYETYQTMHPYGPKADYHWRLNTMERALQAGINDVGIGALFGLYDYRFEVMGLLSHAEYLDKEYKIGPHTISVPRIQSAVNTPLASQIPCPVSDADFKKLVSILRLAVPYTGIIMSTRESPSMRKEIYHLGVSQISAGSKTETGGYSCEKSKSGSQFSINDTRSLDAVVQELIELNFIPSWCTACYRLGRTGKEFMDIAKKGTLHSCCQPNGLLTFAEYLLDYASPLTQEKGWNLIEKLSKDQQQPFLNALQKIKDGKRDLFF